MTKPPVVALDAHNLLCRYFHARPVDLNRDGHNVNAIRGLVELTSRLWRLFSPQRIVAVFDAGLSGRREVLPCYKAHREAPCSGLQYQLDTAHRYLPRLRVDTIRAEGYEADDVLFSLAAAPERDADLIVVSNDKDLAALVRDQPAPRTTIYNVTRAGWTMLDEPGVHERWGVWPNTIVDFLALCGDATDGVAGVPGIGPKTAAELLAELTLDELLEAPWRARRPRWRQLLQQHREQVRLARRVLAPVVVPVAVLTQGTTWATHQ